METITMIFPELEIPTEDMSFNSLEDMTYDISHNIGRLTFEKFLVKMDKVLQKQRTKGVLGNREVKGKHISTRLGDIKYVRTKYKDNGTGQSRYLLDEKLGLVKGQRVSLGRKKRK